MKKQAIHSGKGQADFILTLNKLEVGTLSYADNVWFFSYSEEFKRQGDILPLVNFPTVDKEYSSSELGPSLFPAYRAGHNSKLPKVQKDRIWFRC